MMKRGFGAEFGGVLTQSTKSLADKLLGKLGFYSIRLVGARGKGYPGFGWSRLLPYPSVEIGMFGN